VGSKHGISRFLFSSHFLIKGLMPQEIILVVWLETCSVDSPCLLVRTRMRQLIRRNLVRGCIILIQGEVHYSDPLVNGSRQVIVSQPILTVSGVLHTIISSCY
jgi:hypothetical protein